MAHATSEPPPAAPLALHGLSVEGVNQCVHCGLCLASCPTFAELGTEMDSPRGRIFLIKSLAEGRIGLSDPTVEHLSLCLDCRACETACPSGVPYGRLIEAAKAEIERQRPGGPVRRAFRWLNFGLLLGHPRVLAAAAAGLRLYQASGLQALVRRSGLARLLPGTLPAWEALLPSMPPAAERAALPPLTPGRGPAPRPRRAAHRLRAVGRLRRAQSRDGARARAQRLGRRGPAGQGCCGALNAHGGDHARAVAMAKAHDRDVRGGAAPTRSIVNTSGCGAHMKAFGALLAERAGVGRSAPPPSRPPSRTSPSSSRASRCAVRCARCR